MMKLLISVFMLNFILMFMNNKYIKLFIYNMLMYFIFIMLISNNNYMWMMIYSWVGVDMVSYVLIMLTLWIISLMFLVSLKLKKNVKLFSFMLIMLLLFLLLCFCSMNYFLFYLFFEMSIIPTFLLIMGWGYQPERVEASMYMLLYTMFFSLPLLLIIYYLYFFHLSLHYEFLLNFQICLYSGDYLFKEFMESVFYNYMILAFLVKLPIFMLHMWLPKAHVEAPVSGSMILAGVMLKLGGYGSYRSMLMMLELSIKNNIFYMINSLFGFIILSGVCLRQYDMKLLVAYSSVVHMSMMLMGMMTMMYWGFFGGILMMIGHGFCSPAMFVMVNYFYERTNSRSMMINKGLNYFFPSMMLWWFLICIANMSAPITLNLLSEIMILCSMLNWSLYIILFLMVGMFISACYSLYLFSYVMHGKYSSLLMKIFPMSMNEYLIMIMHWIPLNFLILKLDMFN
nr:NADH dehydrogenase subunit 4 [Hyssopus sp. 1 HHL-2023a]